MAYTLNTSHPLYGSLIELFGVQAGALVSHKTARTFTKHAEATYGTGPWGEHFSSLNGGYTAKGASFTPALALPTNTTPTYTVVAIFNATGTSSSVSSSTLARAAGGAAVRSPGKNSSGALTGFRCTGSAVGTGQRMLTMVRIGETAAKMYLDKVLDFNGTGLAADYNDPGTIANYLLGWDGQAAMAASLVWLAVFSGELTALQLSDLYDSLGASNTFGLIESAASDTTAPTMSGAITISALTTTGYTASWPAGSDNVGVTGYQYRLNGGAWVDIGNVLTTNISSRTPSTTDALDVRDYDAAGNFGIPISANVTLNSVVQGTIALPACCQWETGNLRVGETGVVAIVSNPTSGVLIIKKTGLTTHATTGVCVVTDAAIVPGTSYRVTQVLADGSEGTWVYTAT